MSTISFCGTAPSQAENAVAEILNTDNIVMPGQEKKLTRENEKYLMDFSKPVKNIPFMFDINDVPCIARGAVTTITGRAKSGKSQFAYLLLATILTGRQIGHIMPRANDYKVIMFDTEQMEEEVAMCLLRACNTAGLKYGNHDRLRVYRLSETSVDKLKKVIEEEIEYNRPDIVFVDNIADLCYDTNDRKSSEALRNWFKDLTEKYKCAIICTIHQNENEADRTMMGHLGKTMIRYGTSGFEVSKNDKDGTFEVRNIKTRYEDPGKNTVIEAFKIRSSVGPEVPKDERFKYLYYEPQPFVAERAKAQISEELRGAFKKCFGSDKILKAGILKKRYMDLFKIGPSRYNEIRSAAVLAQVINMSGNDYYLVEKE